MASMNIALPDQMKAWIEEQIAAGRYVSASDYVRDLVRRDQERRQKPTQPPAKPDANGVEDRSLDAVFAETKRKTKATLKARNTVSGAR